MHTVASVNELLAMSPAKRRAALRQASVASGHRPDTSLQLATSQTKNWYFVRDANGTLVKVAGKPTAALIGSYQGKAGTLTRSRKGRTYRKANGSRRYINPLPFDSEVVMY